MRRPAEACVGMPVSSTNNSPDSLVRYAIITRYLSQCFVFLLNTAQVSRPLSNRYFPVWVIGGVLPTQFDEVDDRQDACKRGEHCYRGKVSQARSEQGATDGSMPMPAGGRTAHRTHCWQALIFIRDGHDDAIGLTHHVGNQRGSLFLLSIEHELAVDVDVLAFSCSSTSSHPR